MSVAWQYPKGLRPRTPRRAERLGDLGAAIDAVSKHDIDVVPPRQLADEVVVLLRQIDRLHGAVLARLARVDAHAVAALESGTSTANWLRHHCGLSSTTAADYVRTSRVLQHDMTATKAALDDGQITVNHARTICRTTELVESAMAPEHQADAAKTAEQVLLEVGKAVDAGSLTGFTKRVRNMIDPDGSLLDANRAHERRWLSTSTTLDGMVSIDGLLDPDAGALLLTAIGSNSSPNGADDRRSAGQRRADALVELCSRALTDGALPASGGVRPQVLVTTPLAVLAGRRTPDDPAAELSWAGSVPDETARRISCDAAVTRIVLDPDSLPLDVGRSTRSVPVQLRSALVVRDGGCVAEGCDRPPPWTDAHHVVHWAEGGATSLDNLVLLCRTHHRKVHEDRWEFRTIGGRWKLVPPGSVRTPAALVPSTDSGANERANDVGNGGRDSP